MSYRDAVYSSDGIVDCKGKVTDENVYTWVGNPSKLHSVLLTARIVAIEAPNILM